MDKEVVNKVPNVFVYIDLKIGDDKVGRIIIELFNKIVPKTAENFRALCTGELGIGSKGKPLHYKGTCFHRVVPQFMAQGGDIINDDGSCGDSIYGGPFEDENFILQHDEEGAVGMANNGKDTNSSQFYISTVPCIHLNDMNVVFGVVRKGLNIVREMSDVPRNSDVPLLKCIIENCGEIKPGEDFNINENDQTEDVYPPWPEDFENINEVKIEQVLEDIKKSGNHFFNNKQYDISNKKYRKVLRYIAWIIVSKTNHDTELVRNIKIQTLLNLAAVQLKQHEFLGVIDMCSQVLTIKPKHGKALFRRGQARLLSNEYDRAIIDLDAARKQFPNDKNIQKTYITAKNNKQTYLKKERVVYARMLQ